MMVFLEYFSLFTGLIYMWMQTVQHKWMWPMDILTASAAAAVGFYNHVYGGGIINTYFVIMAFAGIFKWREMEEESGGELHLVKPDAKFVFLNIALVAAGTLLLGFVFTRSSDPFPFADAAAMMLSASATWALYRSYSLNWILWLAADVISAFIFAAQGLVGMCILYSAYSIVSIIGFIHWEKRGKYIGNGKQ